jgi:tRNA(Ile)-lysidine synthase
MSGGGDSAALLFLLTPAARLRSIPVTGLHVRHHLRGPSADEDADEAARQAARAGVAFQRLEADVPAGRTPGESLEAAARRLRYAALLQASHPSPGSGASASGTAIATGHTLDDQAETVLLNLERHAGKYRGGIQERRPDGVIRPLLPFRRAELREYLAEIGVAWREDETNADVRFLRNRIRHETLPALERKSPGTAERLARAGPAWSRRLAALDEEIDRALAESQAPLSGPWQRSLFARLGQEKGARLLILAVGVDGGVPGGAQLDRIVRRLASEAGRFSEGVGGHRLTAHGRGVWIARPAKLTG